MSNAYICISDKAKESNHLQMCDAIRNLYLIDSVTHIRYKMYKWLLELAQRLKGSKETIAAVVDLMQLPESDKYEIAAFEYFLNNRQFLFFVNDELWAAIGGCYCKHYAEKWKPVGLFINCNSFEFHSYSPHDAHN